jgi:hypothetical protein
LAPLKKFAKSPDFYDFPAMPSLPLRLAAAHPFVILLNLLPRTMDDNRAKTISTAAIWISTAVLFTFGVFRFTWSGAEAGFLWMIVAMALAGAPAVATCAIWTPDAFKKNQKMGSDDVPKA